MHHAPNILVALTLALASGATSAAERVSVPADASRTARVAEVQATQALLGQRRASAAPATPASAGPGIKAAPTINPVRTYPPSCLADPLTSTPSGPLYRHSNVDLAATDGAGNYYRETVMITIWRVACSSSETFNSATLMRIDRDAGFEGDTDIYPLFPGINVAQGSVQFDSPALSLIRTATEPNTVIADTVVDSPVVFSTTYVLENYPYEGANTFDFNLPFSIRFDNQFNSGTRFYTISNIPLYNPNATTYPEAFLNIPVTGLLSSNWYDRAKPGEGLVIQIYELPNDPNNLIFAFSWSTFDSTGTPYWLFGQATVARGARSITSPMAYLTGGGFAGTGGAVSPPQIWGTTTFSWPDCNTLNLGFTANSGLPASVPTGSGSRQWKRVANVNGLICE